MYTDSHNPYTSQILVRSYDLKIFLDLDGVVADIVAGITRWYGLPKGQLEAHWQPGRYGFGHAVKAATKHTLSADDLEKTFWKSVSGSDRFWSRLPSLPWAAPLVALVRELDPGYRYLTSPIDCGYCVVGKHRWISERWPGTQGRMIPMQDKWLLARPDRVLVDDHQANVDGWVAAGGKAVLVPALHNRRHAERGNVLGVVAHELKLLFQGGAT